MTPYFAVRPVTFVLTLATVLTWAGLDRVHGWCHRSASGSRHDRGSFFVLVICLLGGCVLGLASTTIDGGRIPGQPVPFVLGLLAAWGGIGLRAAAFRALGRDFTYRVATRPGQPVVDTGPYRYLRHPGYSAVCLILVGLALMTGTWLALAALVALPGAGFVYRIRVEERALASELGEAYASFTATRKRLVPFVW